MVTRVALAATFKRPGKENYRIKINEIKANAPDHNAINLSKCKLTEAQQCLLMKGMSFVPTPSDVHQTSTGMR